MTSQSKTSAPSSAASEAFGSLAQACEPNTIFPIHSKPEHKLEDNIRLAMSRAYIPRNGMSHFGAVTTCTTFPRLALDGVSTTMGGRCKPGTGDPFDPPATLVGTRAAAYLNSMRCKTPSSAAEEPESGSPQLQPPKSPSKPTPPPLPPTPTRFLQSIRTRELAAAASAVVCAEEDVVTAKAVLESLVASTSAMKSQLHDRRLAAALIMDPPARRSENDQIAADAEALKARQSEAEENHRKVCLGLEEAVHHHQTLTDAPLETESAPLGALTDLTAELSLAAHPRSHFRTPTHTPAPTGLAADAGPPSATHRATPSMPPPSPHALPVDFVPTDGVSGEEAGAKAMRNQVTNTLTRGASTAILDAAQQAFPATRAAIRKRFAGDAPPADHGQLSVSCLHALATAQANQDLGLKMCIASAKADAIHGGTLGKELTSMLSNPGFFDTRAARLIADPSFHVELHILEVVAGFIPTFALGVELCRSYYCAAPKSSASNITKLAKEVKLLRGNSLQIAEGTRAFREAYNTALSEQTPIETTMVYRTLLSAIAKASGATCVLAGRDWQKESVTFALCAGSRMQGADADSLQYTPSELSTLVEWLHDFGFAIAKAEAAIQRAADADTHSGRASVEDGEDDAALPPIGTLRQHISSLYSKMLRCLHIRSKPAAQLVAAAPTSTSKPTGPCWDPDCAGIVADDSVLCFACARIHPGTILCTTEQCGGAPRKAGPCNGCHQPAELGLTAPLSSRDERRAMFAALQRHPLPTLSPAAINGPTPHLPRAAAAHPRVRAHALPPDQPPPPSGRSSCPIVSPFWPSTQARHPHHGYTLPLRPTNCRRASTSPTPVLSHCDVAGAPPIPSWT